MLSIVHREWTEVMGSRKAILARWLLAFVCSVLVLLRWPTGEVTDLSGARSLQVLRIFGYGLLAGILLLVPAFPATSLVREKIKGTLALLLCSPLRPLAIYMGKLAGVLGFALIMLLMTIPAAAACHAMGGSIVQGGIVALYAVLALAILQIATVGLYISSHANAPSGALRATYGVVLAESIFCLAPYAFLRGEGGLLEWLAYWVRSLSPLPAVAEALGQNDVAAFGLVSDAGALGRYALMVFLTSGIFAFATIARLNFSIFDRARPAGVMTDDRSLQLRVFRRLFFLVDPQRRTGNASLWLNPVMVKEFRSRRFGRSSWMVRLLLASGVLSLALSYLAAAGALGWGLEVIGGALVLLQVTLLLLFSPSLAASLISTELEAGTWRLLQMTPLPSWRILVGKLMSVAWPIFLLMGATLPGYLVMMSVDPSLVPRIGRVVFCLGMTAVFAVLLSTVIGAYYRSTAEATTASYVLLLATCIGPLLVWLAREAPFGHGTVQTVLTISPLAAALQAAAFPGFTQYDLLPANWWLVGGLNLLLIALLVWRTRQLYRPE